MKPKGATMHMEAQDDNYFFEKAKEESLKSTDLRRPIGIVIAAKNGQIVGRGSNQATFSYFGIPKLHKKYCLRKIFKTPKNRWYWFCPGCAIFRNHAEVRAIRSIKFPKYNLKYMKLRMYMYGHNYCCSVCLKEIEQYNIEVKIYEHK